MMLLNILYKILYGDLYILYMCDRDLFLGGFMKMYFLFLMLFVMIVVVIVLFVGVFVVLVSMDVFMES